MKASYSSFRFRDIDQFMEYNAAWNTDTLSIQLQPGPLLLEDKTLDFGDFFVYHNITRQKFLDRFSIHPDHLSFVFPGYAVDQCTWCGLDVPSGSLAVLHAGREHLAVTPENFTSIGIIINAESVLLQSLLPERLWKQTLQPEKALFQHESERIALLRTQLMALFKSPEKLKRQIKNRSAIVHLRNWILDELRMIFLDIENTQNPGKTPVRKASRRYNIFTRAIDMIESNLTEHLSVGQICEQIGTSPRALQFCFSEILGATPFQYMTARKLHAVQQEIHAVNDPAMTISHLAQDYGFHHAGRFSAQYKQMFGELPRSTLKRKRQESRH